MKQKHLTFALAALLTFSACSPIVATRGNLISDTKMKDLSEGTSTRADVVQHWGPPTAESSFDTNTWYYIGETTEQQGIFAPKVIKRRMIRVSFNPEDNDTVVEIKDLDITTAQDIALVERKTPTAGKEFTAVQQFIGNIGKFNREGMKN